MKKRVSIYIDEGVWKNVKECAWSARKSASGYLEALIRGAGYVVGGSEFSKRLSGQSREGVDIEAANEKLRSWQAEKGIKPASWVGGYSKDKQLGKKGM